MFLTKLLFLFFTSFLSIICVTLFTERRIFSQNMNLRRTLKSCSRRSWRVLTQCWIQPQKVVAEQLSSCGRFRKVSGCCVDLYVWILTFIDPVVTANVISDEDGSVLMLQLPSTLSAVKNSDCQENTVGGLRVKFCS